MKVRSWRCAFCLLLGVGTAAAYVMGDDNRVPVAESDLAMAGVRQTGMIGIAGGDYATGLLTGANCDVVISGGHITLPDAERHAAWGGTQAPPPRLTFHPGIDPGGGIAMETMYAGRGGTVQVDEADDWAVFHLAEPAAGDCDEIPLAPHISDCRDHVVMPAWHFDRRDVQLIERGCSAYASADGRLLVHDCDSKEGSSGAPLFCEGGGGLNLIGINVSGQTRRDYFDPGVYGEHGETFHVLRHKNLAVAVQAEFRRVLELELEASRQRLKATGGPLSPAAETHQRRGHVGGCTPPCSHP